MLLLANQTVLDHVTFMQTWPWQLLQLYIATVPTPLLLLPPHLLLLLLASLLKQWLIFVMIIRQSPSWHWRTRDVFKLSCWRLLVEKGILLVSFSFGRRLVMVTTCVKDIPKFDLIHAVFLSANDCCLLETDAADARNRLCLLVVLGVTKASCIDLRVELTVS